MNIYSLDPDDYGKIDDRLIPFLKNWSAVEEYKNQTVHFPGTWNSSIHPYKYFEVIKKPSDSNYKSDEQENEIGLCLWAGWKSDDNKVAFDDEIDIRLFITGKDVLSGSNKVSAEIHKLAGAKITLFYNKNFVTNFTKSNWFGITPKDKIWIDNMTKFLKDNNSLKN